MAVSYFSCCDKIFGKHLKGGKNYFLVYCIYLIHCGKESMVAVVALGPHGNRVVRQCCPHGPNSKQSMQSGTGGGDHLERPVPCDILPLGKSFLLKAPQASK